MPDSPRRVLVCGVIAVGLTMIASAVWTVLIVVNLKTGAALPWAPVAMAGLIIMAWVGLSVRPITRPGVGARWTTASGRTLAAGLIGLAGLAALWWGLRRIAPFAFPHPPTAGLPWGSLLAFAAVGGLSGAVTEEVGFRGFLLASLATRVPGFVAILATALVMAPLHMATQSFQWQILVFYLAVDLLLGAMALRAGSTLPGMIVHAVGLAVFLLAAGSSAPPRSGLALLGLALSLLVIATQMLAQPRRDVHKPGPPPA